MSNIFFGKIGRLTYFLTYSTLGFAGVILGLALGLEIDDFLAHQRELLSDHKAAIYGAVLIIVQIFFAFATSLRLRDIGRSPLFAFILFVPLVQWFVILYCFFKEGNGEENVHTAPSTQAYSRNNAAAVQTNSVSQHTQPKNAQTSKVLFNAKSRSASKV